jgi:MFS family permease
MHTNATTPPVRLAWTIWGFGATFYLMGFFQRVAPAVMTVELMQEFNLNATALGNLSAFYFYSYVSMQIPTGILADIWGVPYLSTHHNLPATQAAALNSTLLVAWAIGGPIFGGLSDRIGRRKPLYFLGCALAVTGWAVILFIPNLPIFLLVIMLVITGFASGCIIISFAFAKESVPAHLAGTVNGVINMGVISGPTLLQPAVGWMLDRNWSGELLQGIRIYDLTAYRAGFLLMLVWALLSLALLFFTRETRCRQIVK